MYKKASKKQLQKKALLWESEMDGVNLYAQFNINLDNGDWNDGFVPWDDLVKFILVQNNMVDILHEPYCSIVKNYIKDLSPEEYLRNYNLAKKQLRQLE